MPTQSFDFRRILETLAKHGVEFIVVGGVCAVLHGAPVYTFDLDLVHSRTAENVDDCLSHYKNWMPISARFPNDDFDRIALICSRLAISCS